MILSSQIAAYRKKVNLTQEALAEKCGVSRQAVAKWENETSLPDITVIVKLAKIFNITLDELVLGSDINLAKQVIEMKSIDNLEAVWEEVSKAMQEEMTPFTYERIFKSIQPRGVDKENKIIYIAGMDMLTGVIDSRYGKQVREAIKKVVGESYELKYFDDKSSNLNPNNIDIKDVPSGIL